MYTDQNFNMYAWEGWKRYGAQIDVVKSPDGVGVPTEALDVAIDRRPLIVPISHVLFRTSFLQDAQAICARAREWERWSCSTRTSRWAPCRSMYARWAST